MSLNKGSLDAILNKLKIGHLLTSKKGVKLQRLGMTWNDYADSSTTEWKKIKTTDGFHSLASDPTFSSHPNPLVEHPTNKEYVLEGFIQNLLNVYIEALSFDMSWNTGFEGSGEIWTARWYYSIDDGTTWILVGSRIFDRTDDVVETGNFDVSSIEIPLASMSGDLGLRFTLQSDTVGAPLAILTGTTNYFDVYSKINTEGE